MKWERVKPPVKAGMSQEFVVPTSLGNSSADKNDDFVGAADRRETMRDHNYGAALHQALQRTLNIHFRFGIEMRRGFVENQDGCVFQ